MQNRKLIELSMAIRECGDLKGVKFAYAISKNLKNIAKELEAVQETIMKLQKEHAQKDAKEEMIIKDGKIEMVNLTKFNEEYEELMKIENDVTLHKVRREDIPAEITAGQLSGIFDLIE